MGWQQTFHGGEAVKSLMPFQLQKLITNSTRAQNSENTGIRMGRIRVPFRSQEKNSAKGLNVHKPSKMLNSPTLLCLQKSRLNNVTGISIHAWVFYTQDDRYCHILPKISHLVSSSRASWPTWNWQSKSSTYKGSHSMLSHVAVERTTQHVGQQRMQHLVHCIVLHP